MFISGGGDSDVYAVMTRTGNKGLLFYRLQTYNPCLLRLSCLHHVFNKCVNVPGTQTFFKSAFGYTLI